MNDFKLWTIQANDEFGRLFSTYISVSDPLSEFRDIGPAAYKWAFERGIRRILTMMGEAASAEWSCREEPFDWSEDGRSN